MNRFVRLYLELDATTRRNDKLAALRSYLDDVPAEDAAWAVAFLSGHRIRRTVGARHLRAWASEVTGHPPWLVSECHSMVGDLAETLSLLLPPVRDSADEPLHLVVENRVVPLPHLDEAGKREVVESAWRAFDTETRFVWHKLVSGGFRVGVQKSMIARALAEHAGIDAAVMTHRMMGRFQPTADAYRTLINPDATHDALVTPYPFFLASPLETRPTELGALSDWTIEWKWDGIRVQLLRRGDEVCLWSRGEERIDATFPEIIAAGKQLPDGTVIDGELVAWRDDGPGTFAQLQRRLNRTSWEPLLWSEDGVRLIAYDLLESSAEDIRARPLSQRRAQLSDVLASVGQDVPVMQSEAHQCATWDHAAELQSRARETGTEGLMLKRCDSPYRTGRERGDWWKWKVDPFTVDAVLIYAQSGHGRRAGLLTDYTFAVWDGDSLVPIAKAYSGLSDDEIREVDKHLRATTVKRRGGFREVRPELVFELAFEGIQASDRHKSGIAFRFPRMHRWRRDKTAAEADTLDAMKTLLAQQERRR